VPFASRGFSQSRKALKSVGRIQSVSHALQSWWKTIGTQPPPLCSACMTAFFSVWRSLLPAPSWNPNGSVGGIVSGMWTELERAEL
jgi:hypothetical protein